MTRLATPKLPFRSVSIGAMLAAALLLPAAAAAQQITAGPAPTVDADHRAAVIDAVAEALNEIYVFPDVAKKMEEHVRAQLATGAYDELTSLPEFAERLTEDLRSISHDLHLRVRPAPPEPPGEELSEEERERRYREEARYRNFDFVRVERLAGNVGYLRMDSFQDAAVGGDTAIAALNFLAHCDALIVDLRQNGGGAPSMIQLMNSYFFDEPVHLNSFYIRRDDSIRQFWTQANVRGPKMTSTPIYVLTSRNTFSAAEEFTYNLKHMERATIVGETTGGGAHPVEGKPFPELGIVVGVPYGRAVNPITGTNWEGKGVVPHVEVPAAEALDAARLEATRELLAKATDEERKARLQWNLERLEAGRNPLTLTADQLAPYPGTYGPRRIWLEDGELFYQREGRSPYRLIPMAEDVFLLDGLDEFRLRFERGPGGEVTAVIGLYEGGFEDRNERTGP